MSEYRKNTVEQQNSISHNQYHQLFLAYGGCCVITGIEFEVIGNIVSLSVDRPLDSKACTIYHALVILLILN